MRDTAGAEVICFTPNPALDRTLEVPGFRTGEIMRAEAVRVAAGGKGVNVARAFATLGVPSFCMGPLGGASGRMLAELASAEGLHASWSWFDVETRSCLILVDSAAARATVVNEVGPRLSADDWRQTRQDVLARAPRAGEVCVSGSLPPGVSPEELAELCRSLVESGHSPWVDSSGPPLVAALSTRGVRLKINREETQEVLGLPLDSVSACAAASQRLLQRGPVTVVMTLGTEGAVLADAAGCWHAAAPPLQTDSAVASGDSFLAGLVAALIFGRDLREALRWGVAAGTANALARGGARFSREQFDLSLTRVRSSEVARVSM
jgi:1-phosphofructokinase family hexose kinase